MNPFRFVRFLVIPFHLLLSSMPATAQPTTRLPDSWRAYLGNEYQNIILLSYADSAAVVTAKLYYDSENLKLLPPAQQPQVTKVGRVVTFRWPTTSKALPPKGFLEILFDGNTRYNTTFEVSKIPTNTASPGQLTIVSPVSSAGGSQEVALGDISAPSLSNRFRLGANSFRMGQRGNSGSFQPFALQSELVTGSIAETGPQYFTIPRARAAFSVTGGLSYNSETGQFGMTPVTATSIGAKRATALSGTLYTKSTWTNLTDFISNGSGASIVGGAIQLSGGAGDFNKTLELPAPTMQEHLTQSLTIVVGTLTGPPSGIGLGPRSINTIYGRSFGAYFDCSTSFGGAIYMRNINAGVPASLVSSPTMAIAAGDQIQFTLKREGMTYTATAFNLTTKVPPVSCSYTYIQTYPDANFQSPPNTSRLSIYNIGGTHKITGYTVTSQESRYAPLMFVGDSKGAYYGGTDAGRFGNILGKFYFPTQINSGPSDSTTEILARLSEIIAQAPKTVMISIGTNNAYKGMSLTATQTEYASIVSQLTAAGIRVVHLYPFYENTGYTAYLSSFKDWIAATYSLSDIIDCWSPIKANPTYFLAENTHPSPAGHAEIARTILESGKIGSDYTPAALTPTFAVSDNTIPMTNYGTLTGSNISQDPASGTVSFAKGINIAATPTGRLYIPFLGNTSQIQAGTWETQSYATNWGISADNAWYDGATAKIRTRAAGYANWLQTLGNERQLWFAPSSSANADLTSTANLTAKFMANGTFVLGQSLGTSAGSVGGYTIWLDGTNGKINLASQLTPFGTTGNITTTHASGTVNIAAGQSSVTVTYAQATTLSHIQLQVNGNDATARSATVVKLDGSFTIYLDNPGTGEVNVGFIVFN